MFVAHKSVTDSNAYVSKVLVLAAGLENVLEQLEEDKKDVTRI
jgi:hypothetical protein